MELFTRNGLVTQMSMVTWMVARNCGRCNRLRETDDRLGLRLRLRLWGRRIIVCDTLKRTVMVLSLWIAKYCAAFPVASHIICRRRIREGFLNIKATARVSSSLFSSSSAISPGNLEATELGGKRMGVSGF